MTTNDVNQVQDLNQQLDESKNSSFNVTVYASSSSMLEKSYSEAAFSLGEAIARHGWVQVNGGGKGLMGACTEGAVSVGGTVDCVILKRFVKDSMANKDDFREIVVTENMKDRRMGLYKRADAFVALPGGLGTLEELAEVISWRQLEFHNSIIVLLNTNGFYSHLVEFLKRIVSEKFAASAVNHCIKVVDTPDQVITAIEQYHPVHICKDSFMSGTADWLPPNKTYSPLGNGETKPNST